MFWGKKARDRHSVQPSCLGTVEGRRQEAALGYGEVGCLFEMAKENFPTVMTIKAHLTGSPARTGRAPEYLPVSATTVNTQTGILVEYRKSNQRALSLDLLQLC